MPAIKQQVGFLVSTHKIFLNGDAPLFESLVIEFSFADYFSGMNKVAILFTPLI
jgi:hypothetical protein